MPTVNLGRVKPIWRGQFDEEYEYQPLDFLKYNGGLYFCVATPPVGTLPTDDTYFESVINPGDISSIEYWQDLTGSLMRPALTYHNGDYWMLTTDLGDVTEAEPGVSESWERISQDDLGILTPSIISPADGTEGFVGIIESSEYQTGPRFSGSHNKSIFQASIESDFSTIYAEEEITEEPLTEWALPLPDPLTRIWVRVRYESLENSSYWSEPIEVVIADYSADAPTFIDPEEGETDWLPGSTLQISEYSPNLPDDHIATNWQILNPQGTVIWQSLEDADNLTSITPPNDIFDPEETYTLRAAHIGEFFGEQEYGEISVTTIAAPVATHDSPTDSATDVYPGSTLEIENIDSAFTHESSQWRVIRVSDGETVHDSGETTSNLTSYTPPNDTFDPDTEYEWQVRVSTEHYGRGPWSTPTSFTTIAAPVPTNASPADNAVDVLPDDPLESSDMPDGFTHIASQWRVIRVSDSEEVHDSGETEDSLTSYVVPGGFEPDEEYEWQVRYKTEEYGFGDWSTLTSFATISLSDVFDEIGAPFGGGYVAGKIVSDFDGQTYGLIVSDGGGDTERQGAERRVWSTSFTEVSTTNGTPPKTLADGRANHDAIIALDSLSDFPAFQWIEDNCNSGGGLNGHTDWYLPARDELELIYRHFKPTTEENDTDNRRDYEPYFGADGQVFGTNDNSLPPGDGYTSGNPSQTEVSSFQEYEDDSMTARFIRRYWSSTETDDEHAWRAYFTSGSQYPQASKDQINHVRAVRRVAL